MDAQDIVEAAIVLTKVRFPPPLAVASVLRRAQHANAPSGLAPAAKPLRVSLADYAAGGQHV